MNRLLSILFLFIHLSFSMGDMVSYACIMDHAENNITQKESLPEDRSGQESSENTDSSSDICSRSTLIFSELTPLRLSSQKHIEHSTPLGAETKGEIHTPPPEC